MSTHLNNSLSVAVRYLIILSLSLMAIVVAPHRSEAAANAALTRYPYLTDSIQSSITVNWATDTQRPPAA